MSSLQGFYYYYHGFQTIYEYIQTAGEVPLVIGYVLDPSTVPVQGTLYINTQSGLIFEIDSDNNQFPVGNLSNPSIIQDTNSNGAYYYATREGQFFNLQPISSVVYEIPGNTNPGAEITFLTVLGHPSNVYNQITSVAPTATYSFHPATDSNNQPYALGALVENGYFYFNFNYLAVNSQTIVVINNGQTIQVVNLKSVSP